MSSIRRKRCFSSNNVAGKKGRSIQAAHAKVRQLVYHKSTYLGINLFGFVWYSLIKQLSSDFIPAQISTFTVDDKQFSISKAIGFVLKVINTYLNLENWFICPSVTLVCLSFVLQIEHGLLLNVQYWSCTKTLFVERVPAETHCFA